jgi:hypothetical protein
VTDCGFHVAAGCHGLGAACAGQPFSILPQNTPDW